MMTIFVEYVKLNLNSKWEFQCPHVVNVHSYKKIVVAWSLNDAIWLKIDAGNVTIINRLITFNRRQLGKKNFVDQSKATASSCRL